jgi:hypothetical protein
MSMVTHLINSHNTSPIRVDHCNHSSILLKKQRCTSAAIRSLEILSTFQPFAGLIDAQISTSLHQYDSTDFDKLGLDDKAVKKEFCEQVLRQYTSMVLSTQRNIGGDYPDNNVLKT